MTQDTVLQSHLKAKTQRVRSFHLASCGIPHPHSNVKPPAARTLCMKSSKVRYNHQETRTSEQQVNKITRQVSGIPSIQELGIEMLSRSKHFYNHTTCVGRVGGLGFK